MKRDQDLVRTILLLVEAHGTPHNHRPFRVEGYDKHAVSFHVGILYDGGYLRAVKVGDLTDGETWAPQTLTWKGHDHLDAVRSDTVWERTKTRLAAVGGDAPLEVVKALAVKVMTDLV